MQGLLKGFLIQQLYWIVSRPADTLRQLASPGTLSEGRCQIQGRERHFPQQIPGAFQSELLRFNSEIDVHAFQTITTLITSLVFPELVASLPGYEIAAIQHSCAYAYCNPRTLKCTRASLGDGSHCPSVPGVDSSCATLGCRNGSCAVTSNYSANSSCLLITEYQNYQCWLDGVCNGAGHCLYDYGAKNNISCDYIPGNDFCSVQKCRNGTCAQVSPLPDGTSCAQALDVINSVPGPFADYKGCATVSCMHGKCMLKFLLNGTPCNITAINTDLYPDCVNGKCSEGKCQTNSYKPVDTPCGGPCPYGCCAFCNDKQMCHFDTAGPCAINGYDGQCSGTTCVLDPFDNIAGNQFEGVLPDLGLGIKPFAYLTKLRNLDISYNNFQGAFRLDFFASTQNLTWVDISRNYFIGAAPNVTKEGRAVVHANFNCLDRPAKYQRPASVCAGLLAPRGSNTGDTSLAVVLDTADYAANAKKPCDYVPEDDFCSVLKCRCMTVHVVGVSWSATCSPETIACSSVTARHFQLCCTCATCATDICISMNGTCAQVAPLPDGTDCARALLDNGPLTEYMGCATASCMAYAKLTATSRSTRLAMVHVILGAAPSATTKEFAISTMAPATIKTTVADAGVIILDYNSLSGDLPNLLHVCAAENVRTKQIAIGPV
eukprot:SM000099S25196  [mRNA]  locus=s99:4161:18326:- [translate_table: standard]